jgi:hypothetical protein
MHPVLVIDFNCLHCRKIFFNSLVVASPRGGRGRSITTQASYSLLRHRFIARALQPCKLFRYRSYKARSSLHASTQPLPVLSQDTRPCLQPAAIYHQELVGQAGGGIIMCRACCLFLYSQPVPSAQPGGCVPLDRLAASVAGLTTGRPYTCVYAEHSPRARPSAENSSPVQPCACEASTASNGTSYYLI